MEPYDWLLAFEDIASALEVLLPDHDATILVVGCGNSPFSSELFARGYRKLVNVDNCESIITAQRARYPMLDWRVADVQNLDGFDAESVDVVLDKGLLDNLYCYVDASDAVQRFVAEASRVLKPAGRLVALSCHDADATTKALGASDAWTLGVRELPNPRWPRIQIQTYQLAVADKIPASPGRTSESRKALEDLLDAAIRTNAAAAQTNQRDARPPARLDHLDRRASGRRHSRIIADEGLDEGLGTADHASAN